MGIVEQFWFRLKSIVDYSIYFDEEEDEVPMEENVPVPNYVPVERRNRDPELEYPVERVCQHRFNEENEVEFLLKWEGYDAESNSWELYANCKCYPLLMRYIESIMDENVLRTLTGAVDVDVVEHHITQHGVQLCKLYKDLGLKIQHEELDEQWELVQELEQREQERVQEQDRELEEQDRELEEQDRELEEQERRMIRNLEEMEELEEDLEREQVREMEQEREVRGREVREEQQQPREVREEQQQRVQLSRGEKRRLKSIKCSKWHISAMGPSRADVAQRAEIYVQFRVLQRKMDKVADATTASPTPFSANHSYLASSLPALAESIRRTDMDGCGITR
ncbi:hypothetical protein DAPPUDRAFT_267437 [Daphnia pulex]|uniref:Chromo domain-containing protein n=1 Tax=Daphnia pulex TaxID=6669 RepID=E9HWH3_DAPPU|nr:hypothetical protein DAPPUDRAFT_267437 [Daphnia pulex]|eukprot:EFX63908.1 hypothetical protein DAPPUDRAFT_267437 [Daphnia pulex]